MWNRHAFPHSNAKIKPSQVSTNCHFFGVFCESSSYLIIISFKGWNISPFHLQWLFRIIYTLQILLNSESFRARNISVKSFLAAKIKMFKILFAKNESRVWAMSFIADNNFFGPFNGDFTRLIKRIQYLERSSAPLEVS